MKTSTFLSTLLLCSIMSARADVEVTLPELRHIGYLPQDKAELHPEEKLDMKRRNPFAERKKVIASKPAETVETEESKLRAFFDKQEITGVSKFGDKYTAVMGRLTLEAGYTLPPIIPSQTQILRVILVSEKMVEIGWVEEGGYAGYDTATPRKIQKRIKLKPMVEMKLVSDDTTGEKAGWYSVDEKGKTVAPQRNLFPNPSSIVENLPPESDSNPNSSLTGQEQAQKNALETTAQAMGSLVQPEPPPEGEVVPAPAGGLEPPPSTEDAVQPDPDMAPPAPAPVTPAAPKK